MDPAIAVDWVQTVYNAMMAEAINAPNAARIYGYAGVTIYESLYPGMLQNRSLVGQLNGLNDLPFPEDALSYDWEVVTGSAMQTVMSKLFRGASAETLDSFVQARQANIDHASAAGIDQTTIDNSVSFGEELGAGMLAWIADDNYDATREDSAAYVLPTGNAADYVLTTEGTHPAEPLWGQIRPFILDYSDECNVPLNETFSTEEDSVFYQQAMEIYEMSQDLTQDQRDTVDWWIDTPGVTGAPSGHWMMIGSQMVEHLNLDMISTVQMYAMLGVTLADSFISCWSLKYEVNLLRPITYIQQYINRRWTPIVETPPFPEYPSGHSVASAAAADALTNLFGQVAFTDTANTFRGFHERSFFSFEQAATEAAISRMYGGIHFRAAVENGMRQGRCVAERVFDRIVLNPVLQGE
ncbi:MAG: vanadium-dependent haloperoxidase [Anaerolineae bacterium]